MFRRLSVLLVIGGLALTACSNPFHHETAADRRTPPQLGACHDLAVADLTQPSDPKPPVACTQSHTTQTFATGSLPADTGTGYDDKRHGAYVYSVCQQAFWDFLGADESRALRSQLSWSWFRPSRLGWERGARWYRCDAVGGPMEATTLRPLPTDAKGLLATNQADDWLTCARGDTFAGSVKVPCSQPHDWRAVTTVKVGAPTDHYPGDRIVEVRSHDYCQDSVGGWMHYPPDFEFAYSWFHEAEWDAGNRRSICWARTSQ